MTTMYKVTGHAAHATMNTPTGRVRQLFFKGQLLPPDSPQVEIDHLLSVKLISPIQVGEPAEQPQQSGGLADAVQESGDTGATSGVEPVTEGQASGTPATAAESVPDEGSDENRQWAEAQTKAQALVASGSKPDGRSAPLTIAAFLVEKGYDRSAVEKAEKKDLLDLVAGLDG